jgi:hypothetical protein
LNLFPQVKKTLKYHKVLPFPLTNDSKGLSLIFNGH